MSDNGYSTCTKHILLSYRRVLIGIFMLLTEWIRHFVLVLTQPCLKNDWQVPVWEQTIPGWMGSMWRSWERMEGSRSWKLYTVRREQEPCQQMHTQDSLETSVGRADSSNLRAGHLFPIFKDNSRKLDMWVTMWRADSVQTWVKIRKIQNCNVKQDPSRWQVLTTIIMWLLPPSPTMGQRFMTVTGRVTALWKCPSPNTQNLWKCYGSWHKGINPEGRIKVAGADAMV